AALLGGGLSVITAGTKLGLRYSIDASPEPFTNAAANISELGFLSGLLVGVWHHPVVSMLVALLVLILLLLLVRAVWHSAKLAFRSVFRSPAGVAT
ncbi:MAG: DUF4126 domain-containing protein, partial [Gemmatimonadota bacterium]|nr:DUF4126 domain-containing protein [Gemmatimonadota bacterium]